MGVLNEADEAPESGRVLTFRLGFCRRPRRRLREQRPSFRMLAS